MPEIGNRKTLAEMDATPEIHELYPEFDELYTRRNMLVDRLAQLEARAEGRPSFEKRLDKLFEQREQADADLVGIQVRIAKERLELAYRKTKLESKAGKLISQKQVKVNIINKAIARSAYAKEKGVHAELRKDGIIEYSRIYPERPESRMKISFMEMLNTLEGEDIRHLHELYSTKGITKLPSKGTPRITPKTPKLRR